MVNRAETKIHRVRSRHTIYVRKDLIADSAFPFKVGEPLVIRIKGETLIIEKAVK